MSLSKKLFCAAIFLLSSAVTAQIKIAIVPFNFMGVDESSVYSAEAIFKAELMKLGGFDIISSSAVKNALNGESCLDKNCAVELGKKVNAEEVFICSISRLGEKVFAQYFLASANTESVLLADNVSAATVEDLEMVMKRIAASVKLKLPLSKTLEADNVTETESKETLKRKAGKLVGFTFGYLYPVNGYDKNSKSENSSIFTMTFRSGYDMTDYLAGFQIGTKYGIEMGLFTTYMLTKKDLAPYVGASFGFHWVYHDNPPLGEVKKREDGFCFGLDAGFALFRTYNFNLVFNFNFLTTFNDYDDRSFAFTLGILY